MGAGGTYSENFSGIVTTGFGADNSANTWVDNTTLTGWYLTNETTNSFIYNSVLTTADNVGRNYLFELSGDKSIGFRASGTSPNDNLYIGLRLLNNTGAAATSFYLTYYGEQWTIAENESPADVYHINNLAFSYQQGATVTSLLTGAYTNVTALNFIQLHSCTLAVCTGTSAQRVVLDGNLSSNRTLVSGCVDVNIPNGQEIMLRWHDTDNSANDHHLQIDDIGVGFYNVACAIVLPLELLSFDAYIADQKALIKWSTFSETNLEAYIVQHSIDGFVFDDVAEIKPFNRNQHEVYELYDNRPLSGTNYYRLKTIDGNGEARYSTIRMVDFEYSEDKPLVYLDTEGFVHFKQKNADDFNQLTMFDPAGQQIQQFPIQSTEQRFELNNLPEGIYLLQALGKNRSYAQKVLFTK